MGSRRLLRVVRRGVVIIATHVCDPPWFRRRPSLVLSVDGSSTEVGHAAVAKL